MAESALGMDRRWSAQEVEKARTLLAEAQATATEEWAVANALHGYADEHERRAYDADRRVAMFTSIVEQADQQGDAADG